MKQGDLPPELRTFVQYALNPNSPGFRSSWREETDKQEPEFFVKTGWDLNKLKLEALRFTQKSKFKSQSGGAYRAAHRMGIIAEICQHMDNSKKPNGYWTLENLQEEANKFHTKSEFKKTSPKAYSSATNKGFLNLICIHMESERKPDGYWSLDRIKEAALKYQHKVAFEHGDPTAYNQGKALGPKIWNSVCSHMTSPWQNKSQESFREVEGWINKNRTVPNKRSPDLTESRLGRLWANSLSSINFGPLRNALIDKYKLSCARYVQDPS